MKDEQDREGTLIEDVMDRLIQTKSPIYHFEILSDRLLLGVMDVPYYCYFADGERSPMAFRMKWELYTYDEIDEEDPVVYIGNVIWHSSGDAYGVKIITQTDQSWDLSATLHLILDAIDQKLCFDAFKAHKPEDKS